MLRKTFKSSLYVVPITVVTILFATHFWIPNYLIAPPPYSGFAYQLESSIAILLIVFYTFLLTNRFEIELGLVNGYCTLKLATMKVIPVYIYSIVTVLMTIPLYQYKAFDVESGYSARIPISVPDNHRTYMLISILVTVTFFSSLYFFIRVLMRNCYLPVIPDLLLVTLFFGLNERIIKGYSDIRMSLVDPFISSYFMGNSVPNKIAEKYPEMFLLRNAWTNNRIIFLSFSLLLLVSTVFLLRREKLHRGIGD